MCALKSKITNEKPALQISKPICYGTISFYQGKKADEKHTHQWCAFVRGPNGEDLSTYIYKVDFILHPSFEPPQISVTQMPFQIIQTGWGEFDMLMLIYFKGEFTTPLEINHKLKLYHTHNSSSQSCKKPVVSEFYDELVFINPSPKFVKYLNASVVIPQQNIQPPQQTITEGVDQMKDENEEAQNDFHNYFTKFDPTEHKQKLEDALKVVKLEVERLTKELKNIDEETLILHKEINEIR